jgi:8-oxo-dGTP diphosphatase
LKPPRTRAGGFIWRERDGVTEVILMRRVKLGRGEYYVIPGGSVEPGEPIKTAAARELFEETNVKFILEAQLYQSHNPTSKRVAHYFKAWWLGGEPALNPYSPEMVERESSSNEYHPEWVKLSEVSSLALFPSVIRLRVFKDFVEGDEGVFELEETD